MSQFCDLQSSTGQTTVGGCKCFIYLARHRYTAILLVNTSQSSRKIIINSLRAATKAAGLHAEDHSEQPSYRFDNCWTHWCVLYHCFLLPLPAQMELRSRFTNIILSAHHLWPAPHLRSKQQPLGHLFTSNLLSIPSIKLPSLLMLFSPHSSLLYLKWWESA